MYAEYCSAILSSSKVVGSAIYLNVVVVVVVVVVVYLVRSITLHNSVVESKKCKGSLICLLYNLYLL